MSNSILIALFAGLGGMIGWGVADFFVKKTVDKVGDIVTLVWAHIFGTILLAGIVLYENIVFHRQIGVPKNLSSWLFIVFFGVLQALVYLFAYKAFSKGKVALLSPIFASFTGLVAVISIAVFKETVSLFLIVGLVFIFAGIIMVNLDTEAFYKKKIKIGKVTGLREIIIATLFATAWTILWGKFVKDRDWLSYPLFMYVFMTLSAIAISVQQKVRLSFKSSTLILYFVFIGLGEIVAYVAVSLGYSQTTHTSIVAIVSGAFSVPTIILAHLFLKERMLKLQYIGITIIILGIIILSIKF